jgi:hypothetical protein
MKENRRRVMAGVALAALMVGTVVGQARPAAASAPSIGEWTVREGADVSAAIGQEGARVVDLARGAGARPQSLLVRQVPVAGGATADFALEAFDVFTPDARIVAHADGVETPIARPTVALYMGRSRDGAGDMFLAVDGDRIQAVVRHGGETRYVLPWKNGKHVMARGATMPTVVAAEYCGADFLPENQQALARWSEPVGKTALVDGPLREADMMIDVNHSLFGRFGSNTTTATNYMATLLGAVSAIYQRDVNARIRISTLTIWTTPDPFTGSSSSSQLAAYLNWCNANRTGVSRDLAHLFANANVTNYGGIAYVGVLCNLGFGYGVSNIYGSASFPQAGYHWDIDVSAHELGHNFGSPHTHCYSPPIDRCYSGEAGCFVGTTQATTGTIMSYCHLTSAGKTLNFSQREIDVIRADIDGAGCFTTVATTSRDTVGSYIGSSGIFFLRNQHAGGGADVTVGYGPANAGWVAVSGDWNNDGIDTPGLYSPSTGTFFLRNSATPGPAELVFGFGPPAAGWVPIAGDWNGDGIDTVGLYAPSSATFYLRNTNAPGGADRVYSFGPANLTPIAGDWNGDGIDTVGVYSGASGAFFLRNYHSGGSADVVLTYGPSGAGWTPIAGDWNGDSLTTVGLYAPSTGSFFLRNSLTPGPAEQVYAFGPANVTPLAGNWDGQ